MRTKKGAKIILVVSMAVYAISLCFVNYYDDYSTPANNRGIFIVLLGSLYLFSGGASITWLANPALWISWIFINKKTDISMGGSLISTLLCFSFLFFDKIRDATTDMGVDMHTYGTDVLITGLGPGYFFWLLSSLILLGGNVWIYNRKLAK